MRAVVVGVGALGARAARQLLTLPGLSDLGIFDPDDDRRETVVTSLGAPARSCTGSLPAIFKQVDLVVLSGSQSHGPDAERALRAGAHVVSSASSITDTEALLGLDSLARSVGRNLVVGAGFAPGLSCVLAAFGARGLARIDEVHVARVGTGGPACARQLRQARRGVSREWSDSSWRDARHGSGKELVWFPDPIRAVDCHRAALADPLLLMSVFANASRVSARVGVIPGGRRPIDWLRRWQSENDMGAIRVEVRGVTDDDEAVTRVYGAIDRPAVAGGALAAVGGQWAIEDRLGGAGASGLASIGHPGRFLADLAARGVKAAVFQGGYSPPAERSPANSEILSI